MLPSPTTRLYLALSIALAAVAPGEAAPENGPGPASATSLEIPFAGHYEVRLQDPGSYLNCRAAPSLQSRVVAVLGQGERVKVLRAVKTRALWLESELGCFMIGDRGYVQPLAVHPDDNQTRASADTRAGAAGAPIGERIELAQRTPTHLESSLASKPTASAPAASGGLDPDAGSYAWSVELEAEEPELPALVAPQPEPVIDAQAADVAEPEDDDRLPIAPIPPHTPVTAPEPVVATPQPDGLQTMVGPVRNWRPGAYLIRTQSRHGHVNCRDLPSLDSGVFLTLINGEWFDVSYVTDSNEPWLLTEHECFVKADSGYLQQMYQDVPQPTRPPMPVAGTQSVPETPDALEPPLGIAAPQHWVTGRYRIDLRATGGTLNCRDMPSTQSNVFLSLHDGESVDTNFIVHTRGVWLLTTHECFIKADQAYLKPAFTGGAANPQAGAGGSAAAD